MFGNTQSGQLATYFEVTLIVSAIVCLVLLRTYRRAVLRGMRARGGKTCAADGGAAGTPGRGSPEYVAPQRLSPSLGFVELQVRSTPTHYTAAARGYLGDARLFRLGLVYAIASAAHALVLTLFQFASYDVEVTARRFFVVWYTNLWLLAPTLAFLAARQGRVMWHWLGAYLLVGIAVIGLWSAVARFAFGRTEVVPLANVLGFIQLVAWDAGPAAVVIALTSTRRLRPVAPVAIAALLVFGFALLAFQYLEVSLFNLSWLRERWLELATWIGVSTISVGSFLLLSIPVGYASWRLLQWISVRYEAKTFSDWQLLIDCWWVLWTFRAVPRFATALGWQSLWALLAFVVFRLIVHWGLKLAQLDRMPGSNQRLLLLRVFGYQKRTEDLFDRIGHRWRFTGNVQMIAGTDLALRTIDPGDVVAFVAGRLHDQFVRQPADVRRRLEQLDALRDPDGRFRVNEIFCTDDTWQPALVGLLRETDLVLMDLRGFARGRAGCIFELQQLMRHIPLGRVFLIVDHTTDVALLQETLYAAWGGGARAGVNAAGSKVQLFRLEQHTRQAIDALLMLLGSASVATEKPVVLSK